MSDITELCRVELGEPAEWIRSLPHDQLRFLADSAWNGWGEKFAPIAEYIVERCYPGCSISGLGMFVLEPGQIHPAHRDDQPPEWITRVHVPIMTNPHAVATTDEGPINMQVGIAYKFNTLGLHSVSNAGVTPRVHFVFDVHG